MFCLSMLVGVVSLILSGCSECPPKCPECTQPKKVCVPVTNKVCKTDYVCEDRMVCKKETVRKPRTICQDVTTYKEKTICEPLPIVREECPAPCPPVKDTGTCPPAKDTCNPCNGK
jgi:hypothetical protein